MVPQNVEIKAIQLPQDSLKIRIQRGQSLTFRGAPFAGRLVTLPGSPGQSYYMGTV